MKRKSVLAGALSVAMVVGSLTLPENISKNIKSKMDIHRVSIFNVTGNSKSCIFAV